MNSKRLQITRGLLNYIRALSNTTKLEPSFIHNGYYSTLTMDIFTNDVIDRHRSKMQRYDVSDLRIQHCKTTSTKNSIVKTSNSELDAIFADLLIKNNDKLAKELIIECQTIRKYITFMTLIKLFKHYSQEGKPDVVQILQSYCLKMHSHSYYTRNGEFLHYLAKAQCMKGNSDIGLTILKKCYGKYEGLRSFYRILFKYLIQDSVLNRSEASLVVFKKYVLEFSEQWSEHYPLLCFWHMCWASTWFSDQKLSNELLEASESLQKIVEDKAMAFSIMALKDYNEDAVVRLLQLLLKYDMMTAYVAVLQVLFNYKLRNRDIRGCTEIIRNCEFLGVTLPSNQQGRYITMLIEDKKNISNESPTKITSFKKFKLKF